MIRHLSLAALCILVSTGLASAQDDDQPSIDEIPHITVLGTAATVVAPDSAEIRIGVTTEKPSAGEAWDANSTLTRGIIDAAKAAGVKPQDIGTSSISMFEETDNVRQPDGTFKTARRGFRASHDLSIRTNAIETIGSLTQALIDKGANTFQGVSFSVATATALRDKLGADALRNARQKAAILAEAGGVKLGRLLQVEPSGRPSPIGPVLRQAAAGASTMAVEPGTETLSDSVEATYAIE